MVAGDIARRVTERDFQALLLVHRRELVRQAIDTLTEMVPGLSIGVEARGWPAMPWAKLQVGMVQTMVRRESVIQPRLIIVDEAHHALAKSWETLVERYPKAWILGLTATPERLDGKGLIKHFRTLVQGPTINQLVDQGYLSKTRTIRLPKDIMLHGVRTNRRGEYNKEDTDQKLDGRIMADTVSAYLNYAAGRRAIFFGITREHSRQVCAALRAAGVAAEHVDGDDSDSRRDRIMAGLKDGGLDVVGNVDLISEGFDAPGCDCILAGAHTSSITRYLQWNRASRIDPRNPDKDALFVDLTGVSHELGLPDEDREWTLEDGEISTRKKTGGRTPRTCVACRTSFHGNRCPHCGAEVQSPEPDVINVETELEEATPNKQDPGPGRTLAREVAMCKHAPDPRAALDAIAKARKYKPGWVNHVLGAWERSGQLR